MREVMTVLGPVAAQDLGIVLPHEHLLLDLSRVTRNADHLLNEPALAVAEVTAFRDAGGRTIVDVTTRGLKRDHLAVTAIARETGLNIVMGAGWYRESFYDRSIDERSTDAIADEIVTDLTEGMDGSDIRCGVIGEIGVDWGYISPAEERVHRAAARAHLRTGVTITTHGVRSPVGLDQLDLLEEEGVDPKTVVVGHCDFYPFPEYHAAVARPGAFVQFDSIGRGFFDWDIGQRVTWVMNLVRAGHLRQILLSHDVCMKPHLKAYGGQGYDYVPTQFAARLVAAGLDPAEVRVMLIDNPRDALAGRS
jgi:phosphotriesterase-related protein